MSKRTRRENFSSNFKARHIGLMFLVLSGLFIVSSGIWSLDPEKAIKEPDGVANGEKFPSKSQGTMETPQLFLTWGSSGNQPGEFGGPAGIAINGSGAVYIVDSLNDRVQVFSQMGEFLHTWGQAGTLDGDFTYPSLIAINQSGNVFVSDVNGRVQVFDQMGTWIFTITGITNAAGIAINSTGHIYIVDTDEDLIRVTDNAGNPVYVWGQSGQADGELSGPRGILINSTGHVYVVDSDNNRTQIFDQTGNYISKIGTGTGTGDLQFNAPSSIANDSQGNFYITDTENHRVQVVDSNGNFLCKFGKNGGDGTSGTGDGEFNMTTGIAVNGSGYIYVSDYENNRTQVFVSPEAEPEVEDYPIDALIYEIAYTDFASEYWKFSDFEMVTGAEYIDVVANVWKWNTPSSTWIKHPDFVDDNLTISRTSATGEGDLNIWVPHHNYTGPFLRNDGHAYLPNQVAGDKFLEMPNLLHWTEEDVDLTATDLKNLYQPNALVKAKLLDGQSFTDSLGTLSYTAYQETTKQTDNAVWNFKLQNGQAVKLEWISVTINASGILTHCTLESPSYKFSMTLKPTWSGAPCNVTGTEWGNKVGDVISMDENVGGISSRVRYTVTKIDSCATQLVVFSGALTSSLDPNDDPTIYAPASKIFAKREVWVPSLSQWVENITKAAFGEPQTDGTLVIGCATKNGGLPVTYKKGEDRTDVYKMLLMPKSTGGPTTATGGITARIAGPLPAATTTEGYAYNVDLFSKLVKDIKSVKGTPDKPAIVANIDDIDVSVNTTKTTLNVEFDYEGVHCYANSTFDPETGVCTVVSKLPTADGGFEETTTTFKGYKSVDETKGGFNIWDYWWLLLIIGVAVAALVAVAVLKRRGRTGEAEKVVPSDKGEETAAGDKKAEKQHQKQVKAYHSQLEKQFKEGKLEDATKTQALLDEELKNVTDPKFTEEWRRKTAEWPVILQNEKKWYGRIQKLKGEVEQGFADEDMEVVIDKAGDIMENKSALASPALLAETDKYLESVEARQNEALAKMDDAARNESLKRQIEELDEVGDNLVYWLRFPQAREVHQKQLKIATDVGDPDISAGVEGKIVKVDGYIDECKAFKYDKWDLKPFRFIGESRLDFVEVFQDQAAAETLKADLIKEGAGKDDVIILSKSAPQFQGLGPYNSVGQCFAVYKKRPE